MKYRVVTKAGHVVRLNDFYRTVLESEDREKMAKICRELNDYRPNSTLAPYRVEEIGK